MRVRAKLRQLLGDRRGVAAIEFAIIAPVMILLFCGMVEIGQGLIAVRRATHATSELGDLVAQDDNLHDSEAQDAFAAAADTLSPMPVDTLKLRITSVTGVSKNKIPLPPVVPGTCNAKPLVDWSDGYNGFTPYTKSVAPPVTLPTGLICNVGDTIILSESSYDYVSPIGYVLPDGLAFQTSAYLRPRQGTVQRTSP